MEIIEINKKYLVLDPENPRGKINDEDVDLLLQSIESDGQQEAVHLEMLKKNEYLVTEGNKRVKAIMKSRKINTVKAIVEHKMTPEQRLLKQIIIDSHRSNWDIASRDKAWKKLWDKGNYTPTTFAKKLSIDLSSAISFVDRMNLGTEFIEQIPNVSAYNITETKRISNKDVRKKVLKYAHKKELARKEIRELTEVANKVGEKVLKEVFDEKISIADAKNLIGLNEQEQGQALITTKGLNKHKKNLKKMLKSGDIKEEHVEKIRLISDLVTDFQMEFFKTSSSVRQLSSKLKYMKDQDLEKYANTAMSKILESCLEELEEAVVPAITQIKQSIKGIKYKQLEEKK